METETWTAAVQSQRQPEQWNLATRIAFRFCFVYFGLYCLATQILTGLLPLPDASGFWPVRPVVTWTAAHIFRVATPLVYTHSGSGDKTIDWVLVFCLLVFAVLVAAIWSLIDRKRAHYVATYKWFRLAIRFFLAGQMIAYGLLKVVPLQMPYPYLVRLVEPFGNFSPMGVLWSSIGASPGYEIFAGCAELLGGILLIFPRTTTFGALVCLADMIQVFVLNMTYDVPVKLASFHLILLALFLLAPELPRLVSFFFLDRAVEPSGQPPLFAGRRANRIALVAQIVFGVWLLGMNGYSSYVRWYSFGGAGPKSSLYGVWEVEQQSIDDVSRSPLLTDYDRWRRAIFDFPTRMVFQRMDDSFARYGSSINVNDKTLALTKEDDKNWKANFTFERSSADQLTLDGDMDGHKTRMRLKLIDRNKFLLISRGFHWVQEFPLNR